MSPVRPNGTSGGRSALSLRLSAKHGESVPEVARGRQPETCEQVAAEGLRTVLFTDIVGSTQKQAELGDRGWRDLLLAHRRVVRASLDRWSGVENDTAGDGFYITFTEAADGVACALQIIDEAPELALQVRAGLHFGTCELAEDRCSGLTVSIGARVAALARPSEALVTEAVRAALPDHRFVLVDRGCHLLKGVPGGWRLYRVERQVTP